MRKTGRGIAEKVLGGHCDDDDVDSRIWRGEYDGVFVLLMR